MYEKYVTVHVQHRFISLWTVNVGESWPKNEQHFLDIEAVRSRVSFAMSTSASAWKDHSAAVIKVAAMSSAAFLTTATPLWRQRSSRFIIVSIRATRLQVWNTNSLVLFAVARHLPPLTWHLDYQIILTQNTSHFFKCNIKILLLTQCNNLCSIEQYKSIT